MGYKYEVKGMAVLPYEVYKVLEEEIGKERAEKVGKVIEEVLNTIEKKAQEQKLIVKGELKDELTKELATKADIAETRADITVAKAELREDIAGIKAEIAELRAEIRVIKFLVFLLAGLVVFFNRDTMPILLEVVKTLLNVFK